MANRSPQEGAAVGGGGVGGAEGGGGGGGGGGGAGEGAMAWEEELERAAREARRHGFLTPFTDLRLVPEDGEEGDEEEENGDSYHYAHDVEPSSSWLAETTTISYGDLSPLLLSQVGHAYVQ